MIIYEITTTVPNELIGDYEKYMQEIHIPDLLATGYFGKAYFTRSGENRYRVQYHAYDQNALVEYLKNDAQRLREHFHSHFPKGIELSRENWEILEEFAK